jgi:hypothetical protein
VLHNICNALYRILFLVVLCFLNREYKDVDSTTIFISFLIVAFCPLLVFYFFIAVNSFQGALSAPALYLLLSHPPTWAQPQRTISTPHSFFERLYQLLPAFSGSALGYCFDWIVFQGLLYRYLPSKIGYGQRTPAGYLLSYKACIYITRFASAIYHEPPNRVCDILKLTWNNIILLCYSFSLIRSMDY